MWDDFLEEVKITKSKNTYISYSNALRNFTTGGREEVVKYIAKEGIKDSTKKQNLTILLTALNWYGQAGKVITRTIHSYRVNEVEQPCPTNKEVEKIWDKIKDSRGRAIFALMAWNGLRIGEIIGLDLEDYSNGMLLLRNTKGKKDTKAPLVHQRVTFFLQEYLLKDRKKMGNNNPAMFLGRNGKRITSSNLKKWIKRLCVSAGYPKYHAHSFRRYFANTLSSAGVPLQLLKSCMRHRSIGTTMKYLNISPNDVKDTLEKVYNND